MLLTPNSTKQTIWDAGGIDILDFSQLSFNSTGYHLDLNPGGMLASQKYYDTAVAIMLMVPFTIQLDQELRSLMMFS